MNGELLSALAVSLVLTILLETGFFLLTGKRCRWRRWMTGSWRVRVAG